MGRNALLALVCLFLVVSVVVGRTQKVKLKDGREITGVLKKVEGGYQITKKIGAVLEVPDNLVVSIEDVVTPEEEYRQKLSQIDSSSAEGRFALGEWAFRKGLLKIAAQELELATKLDSDHEKAALLLKQVLARLESEPGAAPRIGPSGRGGPRLAGKAFRRKRALTLREVNRIRLAEIGKADKTLRVVFRNKVIERFIDMMREDGEFEDDPRRARKFRQQSAFQKLSYILDTIPADHWKIRDDIVLKSDPKVLQTFRRQVWPVVAKGCASASCHGSPRIKGNLRLFNVAVNDDVGIYTNFLILDTSTARGRDMINRDHPDASLLLQYGLPPGEGSVSHPGNIAPIYRSVKDRAYRTVKSWIDSLNGPPRPNYGVKPRPPFAGKGKGADPSKLSPLKKAPESRPAKKTREDRPKPY